MGIADIIPGVSGGTIAFITGIYEQLIDSISSFDHHFFKNLLKFQFKKAFDYINLKFLLTLFFGIICAILITSRVVHFLLDNYSINTWAFFFGLILSSILFLIKKIENLLSSSAIPALIVGTVVGDLLIDLTPAQTPNDSIYIFMAGMIAICAMILPGISGAFLLLIMGKYSFITSSLKNPFILENIQTIILFCLGCLIGLISFSKVIKWGLTKHYNLMMSVLTGFMLGTLSKVWPWKVTLSSTVIRGKTYILKEANFIPDLNSQVYIACIFMIIGFIIVQLLERSNRGVSSAG